MTLLPAGARLVSLQRMYAHVLSRSALCSFFRNNAGEKLPQGVGMVASKLRSEMYLVALGGKFWHSAEDGCCTPDLGRAVRALLANDSS